MKRVLILLTVLLATTITKAQLSVTNVAPYNSTAYLVNSVLMGNGVAATNITFSGNANQLGYFSNGLAGAVNPLGLDSGIIISTGNINDIPNGGFLSTNFNGVGDPDLLTIAQSVRPGISSTNDAANLEFDFVPAGDTVEFRFVFASEEYLQYINSNFQDIFSFFISGPGFTGPFASPVGFPNGAQNLAVVPGTTTPIMIGTIHPSLNAQYYINNPTGNTFDFNGYTTVMSIKFHVTCGALFHFKFSIADCQDYGWDTGVFMEGSSFSSSAPSLIQFSTAATGGDSTVIEGCSPAILNLTRSDTTGNVTVHYAISGTAINGVDYTLIADSVTYLAGIDTASITIVPLTDAFIEGQETIIITTTSINACGNMVTSSDSMYINDVPILTASSTNINLSCPADSILISTIIAGATPPFTYTWTDSQGNTFGDTADIFVPALLTDTFYVDVVGHCGLMTVSDTIIVTVTPLFTLNTTQSDTNICVGDVINFTTTPSIAGVYTYNWASNFGALGTPTLNNTTGTFNTVGPDTVIITVNSGASCVIRDTAFVNVAAIPSISITTPDTLLDCASNLLMDVDLGGASTPNNLSFNWNFGTTLNDSTIQNPTATPTQAVTDYIIIVTDTTGGCFDTDTVEISTCCIAPTVSFLDATCFDLDDGKIFASATDPFNNLTIEFHMNDLGFTLLQSSTGLNQADSITNLAPGSYIIMITTPVGCSFSDTITITEPAPVTLTNVTPDTIICINGTATLYGTANGINAPILIWDNGLIGSGSHDVNPTADSTTYTVYAQDTNYCVSDTQSVIVALFPPIVISSIELFRDTICKGDTTTIRVAATGGGTDLFYIWLNSNDTIGVTDTNQFIITPSFDGEVFSVIVSDSCTTPTQTLSITTDWSDIVLPTYTVTDVAGCYDQILPTITNTTLNLGSMASVLWDFGDGETDNFPFGTPIIHAYQNPGFYDITLTITDQAGCVWDTIMDGIQIDAHDYPTVDFLWNPNPTDYLNSFITFDNQSTNNVYNEWLFITNAQYTSNAVDPTFQFPQNQPGNYEVTLKITNKIGCQSSLTKTVVIDDVFLFYIPTGFTPNGDGLNDEFKVVGEGLDLNSFKMTVFNKWGQLIFESTNPNIGWNGTQNGALVPDGVYVWMIEAKEAHSPIIHNKDGFVTVVK